MTNILISVPEITHRQIATYELEGLKKLGYNVSTTLYGGVEGQNIVSRLYIIFKNAFSIIKKARKDKIDLVYLNSSFDIYGLIRDFITLMIIRFIRSKIVLKIHGSDANLLMSSNMVYRFMMKKVADWADGFGALSSEEYRNFVNAGFSKDKVFVVKNIINPDVYLKNSEFRLKFCPVDIPIILFVARLIPAKGLLDTLLATNTLKENGYVFKLIVIGDGPEKLKAERIVEEYNLSSFVYFTGFLPEEQLKPFYANGDLMVLPTYHQEGFPMTIFQSVAAGVPIITTKIRAAADYLTEPDNCLWVESKNPAMLAEKIAYILDNSAVSRKMSENNKVISKLFTKDVVCKELDTIFNKILK